MVDDERRAKIEATRAIGAARDLIESRSGLDDKLRLALSHLHDAIAALDRVRDARDDECRINPVSSRMCERGTKACEVEHDDEAGHWPDKWGYWVLVRTDPAPNGVIPSDIEVRGKGTIGRGDVVYVIERGIHERLLRDAAGFEIERLRDRNAALERALGLAADEDLGLSRDGEDVVEAVRALRWNVSDPYSDYAHVIVEGESWRRLQRALAEFSPASTGDREKK